jgi:hypothetical protein
LFIDKILPLEYLFGGLPIFIRVLGAIAAGSFAWFSRRNWEILTGADEPRGSRKRANYEALLAGLRSGRAPAKIYRDWLTKALDRFDLFCGDQGRNDKSWLARALRLDSPGARWTAPAFDT